MDYLKEINELLDRGNDLFKIINELTKGGNYPKAYAIIEQVPPLDEWLKKGKSFNGETYDYIPIGLLEGLMSRVFGQQRIDDLQFGYPINTGKGIAVTVTTKIGYRSLEGDSWLQTTGIATEYCRDFPGLSLSTPKASTQAYKNAVKKIGALFGKYLNRELEDDFEALPITNISEDKELTQALQDISSCTNMKEVTAVMNKYKQYQGTMVFLEEIGKKSKQFK